MKIKVWREYNGKRAKRKITEGVYDENDPRVFGLARFLIDNGNAVEHIEVEKSTRGPRSKKAGNK